MRFYNQCKRKQNALQALFNWYANNVPRSHTTAGHAQWCTPFAVCSKWKPFHAKASLQLLLSLSSFLLLRLQDNREQSMAVVEEAQDELVGLVTEADDDDSPENQNNFYFIVGGFL